MGVLSIWRYPVKAMLGERLDDVEVGPAGLAGDRALVVVDAETGTAIASKRGPTDPALRACRAELRPEGALRVTLPDGATVDGEAIGAALSELLGRPVRLAPFAEPGRAPRLGAPGAHHDFAPVHLLTTGTLARLRALAPGSDADERRFRPNLVLEGGEGFGEDALVGGELRGPSGVRLAVGVPTPRCVVPTRAREELPPDPGLLRALARHHRVDLGPFGRPACLGAYAEVRAGGRLRRGERLDVRPGPAGALAGAGAEVARSLGLP
jgi:uncharacterized protein YcbX